MPPVPFKLLGGLNSEGGNRGSPVDEALTQGDLFTSLVSFSSGLVDGPRGDGVAWTSAAQQVSYPLLTSQAGRRLKELF